MTELAAWLRARLDEDASWVYHSNGGCDGDGVHLSNERWLSEVDAKRQIIDSECAPYPKAAPPMTRTLRLLALPYANEPGYREEWRP